MSRRAVVSPVEVRGDDDRAHGGARRVLRVAYRDVVEIVGVQRRGRRHVSGDRLGVGVQKQLGGVAARTVLGVVGAVDAVPVVLARLDGGQVGVPHVRVHLRQLDPGLRPGVVEQAQLDSFGDRGEHGEVAARAVVGCAQRIGLPGPRGGRRRESGVGGCCGPGPAGRGGRRVRRHGDTLPRACLLGAAEPALPARSGTIWPRARALLPFLPHRSSVAARGCGSVGRASPCQGEGRGFESRHPLGRLAQRERASLTRKRSLVRSQYRPPP